MKKKLASYNILLDLVAPASSYSREVMTGILRYVGEHPELIVFARARGFGPLVYRSHLEPDGIITYAQSPDHMQQVLALGRKTVNVSARWTNVPFPSVIVDSRAIGAAAAEHLVSRGFLHFGAVGINDWGFAQLRLVGFCDGVNSLIKPRTLATCEITVRGGDRFDDPMREEIRQWLKKLPRPLAVFAVNDALAIEVMHVCEESGWRVPDEIAIMGVDNDPLMCETARPMMTSVDTGAERVGYRAVALLASMMQGRESDGDVLIPPIGVVTRSSTALLAPEDTVIKRALDEMREGICGGITIGKLAKQMGVCRRIVEQRFQLQMGCSPGHILRRLKVEAAREMLVTTDLSIEEVSQRCHYAQPFYFSRVFREATGMTPSTYRQEFRLAARPRLRRA